MSDTLAPRRYSALTRSLHWIVALMVLATLPIGGIMVQEGLSRSTQDLLFILHKNTGVIILALVLVRIAWRLATPTPAMPATMPDWQVRAARAAHVALYGMLMVMAISGYVRVRAGGFPIEMLDALGVPSFVPRSDSLAETAQTIHRNARFVLVALILVHIAAALQHAWKRDGVFSRIWPPVGGKS